MNNAEGPVTGICPRNTRDRNESQQYKQMHLYSFSDQMTEELNIMPILWTKIPLVLEWRRINEMARGQMVKSDTENTYGRIMEDECKHTMDL